uniref:Trans-1,2-dihydrobenzene-1,2-diol dehydrogenase n=1 Tax=Steinernema glaseri TaxID=37863 RepID=A0A1I8A0S5_9BILA
MQLRWGIVGGGNISECFVRSLFNKPENHKVVAVGASSEQRAQQFIDKLNFPAGAPKAYGSYEDLVKDKDIDVVYIGLLNHLHKRNVLLAIAQKKHVLCEKPLGLNEAQVTEMTKAAKEAGVFLMEAFWTKFFPAWQVVKKGVYEKEFGGLKLFTARIGFSRHGANKMQLQYGGGDLMATGCYTVMAAMWIFGEKPSKIEVSGVSLADGVDERASVVLTFSGDRVANLMYTGECDLSCSAEVCCENGRYLIPEQLWAPSKLIKISWDAKVPRKEEVFPLPVEDHSAYKYPDASAMLWEAEHVHHCLQNNLTESPVISHKDMLELSQVLDEILRQSGVMYPDSIL